ncbi:MAG TPA: L-rhamnose mutarotase [Pedobacter sp.]|jgi:L-rhamnose mutarotase
MALDLQDDAELILLYEQYHTPAGIWPEIPHGIREAGITDLQIYRIGNHLFMIVDCEEGISLQAAFEKMLTFPRQKDWAALMLTFQKKLTEAKPDEHWALMKPVFLLEDCK